MKQSDLSDHTLVGIGRENIPLSKCFILGKGIIIITDNRQREHTSACPVRNGEKWSITRARGNLGRGL